MQRKPRFRLATPPAPAGDVQVLINSKMRTVLVRLFTGLPDAEIARLAGPVASAVKALGEALAVARPGSDVPAVVA